MFKCRYVVENKIFEEGLITYAIFEYHYYCYCCYGQNLFAKKERSGEVN
jgi:hypothetical protein